MLTLNTIQLKRMKLPLMKDDFSSSIKITIDSAIPLLGLDIHSHRDMKLHSLQHSLSEQSMVKKKMSIHREVVRSIMEHLCNGICEVIKTNKAALDALIQKDLQHIL